MRWDAEWRRKGERCAKRAPKCVPCGGRKTTLNKREKSVNKSADMCAMRPWPGRERERGREREGESKGRRYHASVARQDPGEGEGLSVGQQAQRRRLHRHVAVVVSLKAVQALAYRQGQG